MKNVIFGIAVGAAMAALWLTLIFGLGPPTGSQRFKHMLAIYLGWIIPAGLLLGYGYLLIARPVILRLDEVGVRWRPFLREHVLPWALVHAVSIHRFKKRRRLVLTARTVDPATQARITAVVGPWSRLVPGGSTLTIANSFHVLPLDEIVLKIAERSKPSVTPMAVDFPSAKAFEGVERQSRGARRRRGSAHE